jgi:hypothetical protein
MGGRTRGVRIGEQMGWVAEEGITADVRVRHDLVGHVRRA